MSEPLQYGVERTIWLIAHEDEAVYSVRAAFHGTDSHGRMCFKAGTSRYLVPYHAYLTEYEALVALHGSLQAQIESLETSARRIEAQLVATGQWKVCEK